MESNTCVNCEENFNLFHKQRIMIPCGDSICLQCFDIFLQPQNELECMKCGETSDISARFKQKVMEMKESIQTIGVFCDTHPTQLAEKYCNQHKVLICGTCAFETHNHSQFIKDATRIDIQKFCDNAVGYLITLRDRITSLVDNLNTYKSKEKSLTSSFLMGAVKEAQEILTTSFLKTDQEKQNIAFLTDNRGPQNLEEIKQPQNASDDNLQARDKIKKPLNAFVDNFLKQEEIKQEQNAFAQNLPKKEEIKKPQKAFVPNLQEKEEVKQMIRPIHQQNVIANPVQAFKFDFDDYSRGMFKITQEEQVLLKQWIGQPVKFRLTYRGTRDGFNYNSYYNECYAIAPTLILIKSKYNEVFGGFTSVQWDQINRYSASILGQADPLAFIFSLTKKTKHSQFQNKDYAIYYDYRYLIGFGYNGDIRISNDCDKNSDSYSDIGGTYKPIGEGKQGSKECQTYLAASKKFKVVEMEAYECII